MRMLSTALPLLTGIVMVLSNQLGAQPATLLNFDGLVDSTSITNQFLGLTFQNAAAISAGISLNEFEFPPHSGTNVAFDSGGTMTITFSSPIQSFAGYFTYSVPLTVQAFGTTGSQIVSVSSRFSSNEALSGVPGSSPNELIQLDSGAGISQIVITGSATGTSFVLDDASTSTAPVCNITQDPTTSVPDVQLMINETLGAAPAADDLNGDGVVNVVDTQIVINAALGRGCSSP
jgi:hypothetical protein